MPTDKVVLAFPGREAYGKELRDGFYRTYPEARRVFELAGDVLHRNMAAVCYRGGAQPEERGLATAVHCYAVYAALQPRFPRPAGFIGYSQGEFIACAAAGVAVFADVLRMLRSLEQILQETSREGQDMIRVMELERQDLLTCCKNAAGGVVGISAYLSADQHVVSGERPALDRVAREAKERGARWVLPLHTRRGFHSPLCDEAGRAAAPYFARIAVETASAPVYSCLDGERSTNGALLWEKLSKQINHPLRWDTLVANLNADGVTRLVELGPGCTVSANARIAGCRFPCQWLHDSKDLEDL